MRSIRYISRTRYRNRWTISQTRCLGGARNSVIELRVGVVNTAGTMLVDAAAHSCCGVIRSLINVTAPLSAYRLPFTLTPSRRDIEVKARILLLKVAELPSVADEPTWKYTLQARAPLISTTDAEEEVVSVELI